MKKEMSNIEKENKRLQENDDKQGKILRSHKKA